MLHLLSIWLIDFAYSYSPFFVQCLLSCSPKQKEARDSVKCKYYDGVLNKNIFMDVDEEPEFPGGQLLICDFL